MVCVSNILEVRANNGFYKVPAQLQAARGTMYSGYVCVWDLGMVKPCLYSSLRIMTNKVMSLSSLSQSCLFTLRLAALCVMH